MIWFHNFIILKEQNKVLKWCKRTTTTTPTYTFPFLPNTDYIDSAVENFTAAAEYFDDLAASVDINE